MAIKVLADGNKKLSILTEKPAAWETTGIPLLTELAAGIDASCLLLLENFQFGAADSDKVSEPALCTDNNANSLGRKNGQAGFSFWRWFDDDGGFDELREFSFLSSSVLTCSPSSADILARSVSTWCSFSCICRSPSARGLTRCSVALNRCSVACSAACC